ncbi:MAG: hypothetical protein ISS48_00015 [Candidatus Aenigmarchaeota archaeon]|nr:hypothetical protein [Candidatus Aenigmarchaeota archaeon]
MKGQVDWPIALIVFSIVIVSGIFLTREHVTAPARRIIQYEQKHDNTQMILISLLSSTHNGKTIQEIIGEHLVLGEPSAEDIKNLLTDRLDKLVETKCYKLSTPSKTLVNTARKGCEPKDYEKDVDITLPYNSGKLTEKLILVIN